MSSNVIGISMSSMSTSAHDACCAGWLGRYACPPDAGGGLHDSALNAVPDWLTDIRACGLNVVTISFRIMNRCSYARFGQVIML